MILQLQQLAFLTVMLALGGFNGAQADNSFTVALNLGSVIGSEQACGLTYDRDPIERFIAEHVKASDMSFPSTLNMMTMGTKVAMKENVGEFPDGPLHSNTSDCERIRIYKIGGHAQALAFV